MNEVTRLLIALGQGDPQAARRLLPLGYDELRGPAAQRLAQARGRVPQVVSGTADGWQSIPAQYGNDVLRALRDRESPSKQGQDAHGSSRFRRRLDSMMTVEHAVGEQELLGIWVGRIGHVHRRLLVVEHGHGQGREVDAGTALPLPVLNAVTL
jgi:hypothetical protein